MNCVYRFPRLAAGVKAVLLHQMDNKVVHVKEIGAAEVDEARGASLNSYC